MSLIQLDLNPSDPQAVEYLLGLGLANLKITSQILFVQISLVNLR